MVDTLEAELAGILNGWLGGAGGSWSDMALSSVAKDIARYIREREAKAASAMKSRCLEEARRQVDYGSGALAKWKRPATAAEIVQAIEAL